MSLLHIVLGPLPCGACAMSVMWVRTHLGLELRGVWYDRGGRRMAPYHECSAVRGQIPAFPKEK